MPRQAKPSAAPAVPEAPEVPPDAVIVMKSVDEEGNIHTDVVMSGTVQATEVQTLLEMGVQGWRQRIGLVG